MSKVKVSIIICTTVLMFGAYLLFTMNSKRDYYIQTIYGSEDIGNKLQVIAYQDRDFHPLLSTKMAITTNGTERELSKGINSKLQVNSESIEEKYYKIFRNRYINYDGFFENDKYIGSIDLYNESIMENNVNLFYYDKQTEKKKQIHFNYSELNPNKTFQNTDLLNVKIKQNKLYVIVVEYDGQKNLLEEDGSHQINKVVNKNALIVAYVYDLETNKSKMLGEQLVVDKNNDNKNRIHEIDELGVYATNIDNYFAYVYTVYLSENREEAERAIISFDIEEEKFSIKEIHTKDKYAVYGLNNYILNHNKLYAFVQNETKERQELVTVNLTDMAVRFTTLPESTNLQVYQKATNNVIFRDKKMAFLSTAITSDGDFEQNIHVIDTTKGSEIYKGRIVFKDKGKMKNTGNILDKISINWMEN